MGELLGLKTTPYGKHNSDCRNPKRLIVINFEDRHFVFLVDEVKGIISYGDDDVVPVPATLNHEDALLLNGAIKSQGILVALFNIDKLKEKLEGVTR
jgi:chemotaxis signal transduction protein